mmetsp:Transcript_8498/g.13042  ORF Transcript_8498/g.13042 Transcript_8498/m.13042 type:complete len:224 (+) Transcript_8498:203-874(+)
MRKDVAQDPRIESPTPKKGTVDNACNLDSDEDKPKGDLTEQEEEQALLEWQLTQIKQRMGGRHFTLPHPLNFQPTKKIIPRFGENKAWLIMWDKFKEKVREGWHVFMFMMPFTKFTNTMEPYPHSWPQKNLFVVKTPGATCVSIFLFLCIVAFLYSQYMEIGKEVISEFNFEPSYDSFEEPFRVGLYYSMSVTLAGFFWDYQHREVDKIKSLIGRDVESEQEY